MGRSTPPVRTPKGLRWAVESLYLHAKLPHGNRDIVKTPLGRTNPNILAEGAIALPVTLSGGALFAS